MAGSQSIHSRHLEVPESPGVRFGSPFCHPQKVRENFSDPGSIIVMLNVVNHPDLQIRSHQGLLGTFEMSFCSRGNLPTLGSPFDKSDLDQVRLVHLLDCPYFFPN